MLGEGNVVASGPIEDTLTTETLTTAFEFPVDLTHDGNRWTARAHPDARFGVS